MFCTVSIRGNWIYIQHTAVLLSSLSVFCFDCRCCCWIRWQFAWGSCRDTDKTKRSEMDRADCAAAGMFTWCFPSCWRSPEAVPFVLLSFSAGNQMRNLVFTPRPSRRHLAVPEATASWEHIITFIIWRALTDGPFPLSALFFTDLM